MIIGFLSVFKPFLSQASHLNNVRFSNFGYQTKNLFYEKAILFAVMLCPVAYRL